MSMHTLMRETEGGVTLTHLACKLNLDETSAMQRFTISLTTKQFSANSLAAGPAGCHAYNSTDHLIEDLDKWSFVAGPISRHLAG